MVRKAGVPLAAQADKLAAKAVQRQPPEVMAVFQAAADEAAVLVTSQLASEAAVAAAVANGGASAQHFPLPVSLAGRDPYVWYTPEDDRQVSQGGKRQGLRATDACRSGFGSQCKTNTSGRELYVWCMLEADQQMHARV